MAKKKLSEGLAIPISRQGPQPEQEKESRGMISGAYFTLIFWNYLIWFVVLGLYAILAYFMTRLR